MDSYSENRRPDPLLITKGKFTEKVNIEFQGFKET